MLGFLKTWVLSQELSGLQLVAGLLVVAGSLQLLSIALDKFTAIQ